MGRLALVFAVVAVFAAGGVRAQTATLVADRISIEGDGTLVAEGNVEVTYETARLTATRVRYDREGEQLAIEGPLVLTEADGTIVLASSAELSPSFRAGILNSARIVLDRRLQLAAARIDRSGDRFTRMSRVVASSCEVCPGIDRPLWEIRARRVIRDEQERQLYFDNAQLRIIGVPVFWLPQLRLPDPTLERANGFLVPNLRSRSGLGTGIEAPYFITLGDHADLTFSPFLSSSTTSLGASYRHELTFGRLSFEGALSRDELREGTTRAYLFGDGLFYLPRDFRLSFDLELVSDDSYLSDYDITDDDRLESELRLSRVRDDQWIVAEVISFRSLRGRKQNQELELSSEVAGFGFSQRLFEDPVWGQAWAEVSGAAVYRPSDEPRFGRDVNRIEAALGWDASRVVGPGLVAEAEAGVALDLYDTRQDPAFPGSAQRLTSSAAVALSWPMQRVAPDGSSHLLEPKVQLAWTETSGDPVPNEDSQVVEFDEGNLFALSRYPGIDERETGLRANIGLGWTRYDPDGWSLGVTLGRVIRFDDRDQFADDTGLSGGLSDWLVAGSLRIDDRLELLSRTLLGDNLDFTRSETRLTWRDERLAIAGTHIWEAAEPQEGRPDDLSEIGVGGAYRFDPTWAATGNWRLNADEGKTTRAGLGLQYRNECITVDLSLSRRFTSSTTVEPATDIDLQVSLTGFGLGDDPGVVRRSCSG
jgi:LPS-assembly protein